MADSPFMAVMSAGDSERGTEVAALFYSLIESSKLAGVEPDAYLRSAARAAVRGQAIPLPYEVVKA